MKQKISITIDQKLIDLVENMLNDGLFRNRSHVIEYSIKKFIEGKKNE